MRPNIGAMQLRQKFVQMLGTMLGMTLGLC